MWTIIIIACCTQFIAKYLQYCLKLLIIHISSSIVIIRNKKTIRNRIRTWKKSEPSCCTWTTHCHCQMLNTYQTISCKIIICIKIVIRYIEIYTCIRWKISWTYWWIGVELQISIVVTIVIVVKVLFVIDKNGETCW